MISKEEVKTLAELARIKLSDGELDRYEREFAQILSYVSFIKDAPVPEGLEFEDLSKNIMRDDEDAYTPGSFSDDILRELPHREGNYVKVKRVL